MNGPMNNLKANITVSTCCADINETTKQTFIDAMECCTQLAKYIGLMPCIMSSYACLKHLSNVLRSKAEPYQLTCLSSRRLTVINYA